MGPGQSQAKMTTRDSNINRELKKLYKTEKNVHKLLLLGAGESGKTTVFKQMVLSKGSGFDNDYRRSLKPQIFTNLLQGTLSLIDGCRDFNLPITDPSLLAAVKTVREVFAGNRKQKGPNLVSNDMVVLPAGFELTADVAQAILDLWNSNSFEHVFEACVKIGQYNLPDTYKEYMKKLKSFPAWGGTNWVPDVNDCLLVRQRTTGFAQALFVNKGFRFQLIDVGGQRSERKKWMHLFDGVTAVIFVSSLSEYDQTLWENSKVNRFKESLSLFKQHAEMSYFKDSAFILFLNKVDLFKEKYLEQKIPINYSGLFPDAPTLEDEKPGSCELALAWFRDMMLSSVDQTKRDIIYVHYTNALDTDKMSEVIDYCAEHIVHQSLVLSGIKPKSDPM